MNVTDWLAGAADTQLFHHTPESDNVGSDVEEIAAGERETTDPLLIELDYKDAKGVITHRTIVAQYVSHGVDGGVVSGFCLLRRKRRTFFFERILGITTRDGEYLSAPEFFFNRLGIDRYGMITDFADDRKRRAAYPNDVRTILRPKLGLLVIAARIDGILHREELDRILTYAERELLAADNAGCLPTPLTLEMAIEMERAVNSMFPDSSLVPGYLADIERLTSRDRQKFWRAFCDVINADNIVAPEERRLLAEIERLQLGKR